MNRRILVIDDEGDMCSLIERVLKQKDFEVKTVTNSRNALRLIEKESFVLLVVDLRMSEIDGLELIRRARQCGFRNKCIIITAYPSVEAIKEAEKYGITDFLFKPLDIRELEDAVMRAVGISEDKEVMG